MNDVRARFRWKSLGLAILSVLVLVAIAPLVDGDRVTAFERSAFRFLNDLPGFLYRPMWPVMQLGNLLVLPLAFGVALILRRWLLAMGIASLIIGKMRLGQVVKAQVVRHRPEALLENVHARDDTGLGQAFVSGHVVVAVGLATLLHPYLSRRWRIVAWSLAALVSLGRVYVGAHFPLDVVGGAALGAAMGFVLHAIIGPPATTVPPLESPGPEQADR